MTDYPPKVVLHYLYLSHRKVEDIKEYKFSNQFNIQMKENVVNVSENRNYVSNFYGEHISNLSVAIGANGSGKTKLCETIINVLQNPTAYLGNNIVCLIYSENDQLFCFNSNEITFNPESLPVTPKYMRDDKYHWYEALHPIFLTLVINFSQFNNHFLTDGVNYSIVTSLSTFHVMKNAVNKMDKTHDNQKPTRNKMGFEDMFNLFIENEMNEMLRVIEHRDLFKKSGIKIPSHLKVKVPFFESTTYSDLESSLSEIATEINDVFWKIRASKDLNYYQKYKRTFVNRCIYSLLNNYRIIIISNKVLQSIVDTQVNQIVNAYLNDYGNENFLKEIEKLFADDSAGLNIIKDNYLDYFVEINECIDELFEDNILNESLRDTDFIFVSFAKSEKKIKKLVKLLFSKNISMRPVSLQLSHLNSSINISAGELNFFTFFSRLLSVEFNDLPRNLILMIDEADLTFHPQLQKQFLGLILPFLDTVFTKSLGKKYNKPAPNIQVLITTHSPIMLSDLISNSVINLEEQVEDSKSTFAKNIHELFNNDFILRDGLIGDFAESKINEIVDYIQNNETFEKKKMARFFKIIKNISEPYLQYKLFELLEEAADPGLKNKVDMEEKTLIQEQINKLNTLKNYDSNTPEE